ncbi:60S ribosomal L24 [Gossypium arboreum]|uniref:60S ribosomal L24 n=1 Tax=Gossypium arboreum TaxID=29729 RepID=A0A0B0MRJ1_GOSAR|nr:60S ribosomal L24 [Gossypium arboreum]
MVPKTERCRFSGAKIYPGKGIRFIRSDSQRYFHNRLKPSKLTWTAMYRKQHKKDIAQEAVKKRRRATKKPYSRSIVGATLELNFSDPNKKMGCGMAEFELRYRLESLIINEEEFIKSSVPEIVEIYDDPTKRGINNVKVTATDDLTREGVQSKFHDLENKLYDKGNHKVKCKDFPGLELALKNTARWEIPEYLKSIAILTEKDRGKATEFYQINIQTLVCAAIKEMKDFSVGDLDWDTLKKWGATLNCAEKFDFQVRFADNLLKKHLLAYFAAQNIPKSTAKK